MRGGRNFRSKYVQIVSVAFEELFREHALAHLALVCVQHAVSVEIEALG